MPYFTFISENAVSVKKIGESQAKIKMATLCIERSFYPWKVI